MCVHPRLTHNADCRCRAPGEGKQKPPGILQWPTNSLPDSSSPTMPLPNSTPGHLGGGEARGSNMRWLTASRPVDYARRAALAASYPLIGIWYFLRNKEFWPLFTGRLLPLSLISLLVYLILFTFAFLPQWLFLAIFHSWWSAWLNAVVLTLGEGLVIIQGLFEGFFVDECRVDVFDVSR